MNLNDLLAAERQRRGLDTPPEAAPTPARRLALVDNSNPRAASWVATKVQRSLDELATMPPDSGRNAALNATAYSLGRLVPRWLDETDVRERLIDACRSNGLLAEDGRRQCEQTIASGLGKGMDEPRDPPIDPDDPSGGLASLVAGDVAVAPLRTAAGATEAPPAPSDAPDGDEEVLSPEERAERLHANRVQFELVQLRARHDAKLLHTSELAARTFRAPAYTRTLTDELLIPDAPVRYAVEGLLPAGGNALLAAQFKAGKTTLVSNLLRAYADSEPFLGRFEVAPGTGRIAIFNYELSPDQYRSWLREVGIRNTDAVAVLHLRGYRLPLTAESVEDWVVAWLIEQDVSFWIADPFARAATGVDENSNTDVGVWLDTFDVIKERAGVSEAVLPTHTGRAEMEQGQERARGATRLDDWADVRWLLTRDEEGDRFFRATGRDVELGEEQLHYDPLSRLLTMGGGDRKWRKQRRREHALLDWVAANPGAGTRDIEAGVGTRNGTSAVVAGLVVSGHLRFEMDGNKKAHFVTGKALV